MNKTVFNIVPASISTFIGFAFVFLLMLPPLVSLIYGFKELKNSTIGFWIGILGIVIIVLVTVIFGLFAYSAKNSKIIVNENNLTIKTFLYGRTLAREDFVYMMSLDLRNQTSFKPVIRTNGIGMPGYQAGWFRLVNKEKSLLVLTDSSKVIYLSTNKGYSLLLSISEQQEFIKIMNDWIKSSS